MLLLPMTEQAKDQRLLRPVTSSSFGSRERETSVRKATE